jgi:serine/threonine protein kinase
VVGKSLSHYKILAELGRGGMGIVYMAEDTKLDRTVAIKVLPSAALASEDDRARFYREAKAAAQLHHPHIASVFEIDEAVPSDAPHGTPASPFIAMEFIDGETLQERTKHGPLKLEEAVRIASEIASALDAAHEKDIVHRDIKSANVMLTAKGSVKVLDFGLAKTAASTKLTKLGSTVGTVAYMSPEQARGEEVDLRTDLWSLGAVLYEMIAGRVPFPGDYEQAVLYEILNQDPEPLTALRTGVPMDLERHVGKLLKKKTEHRYQSAAGLLADLRSLDFTLRHQSRGDAPSPIVQDSAALPKWVWGMLAAVALISASLGWLAKPAPVEPSPSPRQFTLELPDAFGGRIAWSPDESKLLYSAVDSQAYIGQYDLVTGEHTRVPGTERGASPRFSPDGRNLAFTRSRRTGPDAPPEYDVVWLSSGATRGLQIASGIQSDMLSWLSDEEVLFLSVDGVVAYNLVSGDRRTLIAPDSSGAAYRSVAVSPDSRFVYLGLAGAFGTPRQYDQASGEIRILSDFGGEIEQLTKDWIAVSLGGFGGVRARRLDPRSGLPVGPPAAAFSVRVNTRPFSISQSGHLAYLPQVVRVGAREPIYRVDGTQRTALVRTGLDLSTSDFVLAPDGESMVIEAGGNAWVGGHATELWWYQFGSGRKIRLLPESNYGGPSYSGDSQTVYFHQIDSGVGSIHKASLEGLRTNSEVVAGEADDRFPVADASENVLLFQRLDQETGWDIWVKDLVSGREQSLVDFAGDQTKPVLSPDGRLVSFESHVGDQRSVLLGQVEGGRTIEVGSGLARPQFAHDGQSLLFSDVERRTVYRQRLDPENPLQVSGDWDVLYSLPRGEHLHFAPAPGDEPLVVAYGIRTSNTWKVILNWTSTVDRALPD